MNEFKKTYPAKQYEVTNNGECYNFYTNGELDISYVCDYKEFAEYIEYINKMDDLIKIYGYEESFNLYKAWYDLDYDINEVIKSLEKPRHPDFPDEEITKEHYKEMIKKLKDFEKILERYIETED